MIFLRRLLIIVLSTVTFLVLRFASDSWLDRVFAKWLGWKGSDKLAEVAMCLMVIAVVASFPKLRRELKIHFRPTWLLLAAFPLVAVNVLFWKEPPSDQTVPTSASLALGMMAAGVNEELFLRGFAFAKGGEATPKFSVAVTALVFGLAHFFNLTSGEPFFNVVATVILASQIGLIFGLIRIVTGSIFWCVLVHASVNATFVFTHSEAELYGPLAAIFVVLTFVAGMICFFKHPKMQTGRLKFSA